MPILRRISELPVSAQTAQTWHAQPAAMARLTPPWLHLSPWAGGLGEGPGSTTQWLRFVLRMGLLHRRWDLERSPLAEEHGWVTHQQRGPFRRWVHVERFLPRGDHACLLVDEVDWAWPRWLPARLWCGRTPRPALECAFALRHARAAHDLARHAVDASGAPLVVAVSGASGLVGRRLCAFLAAGGHQVRRLVRPGSHREPGEDTIAWDPASGRIDARALRGVDAVVHLAGANLAGGRWSARRKRELWASRVESTALLARTLAAMERPPRVLVVASAIGYYGDCGQAPVDEAAPRGSGFLAELCEAWEAAAEPARAAGIRTVHVRTGLVLAGEGGVLARLAPLFAAGLGGPLGNGRQRMSWIALEDLLTVFHRALLDDAWEGPVNAVAPDAPSNAAFTRALAHVLRRPAPWRAPAWAIRLGLGQLGSEALLAGQRVVPARLQAAGFAWRLPRLEDALAEELGRAPVESATA